MRIGKLWLNGLVVAALALLLLAARGDPKARGKLKVGTKPLDFELKDLSGRKVKLADAAKGNVVVLKFGATWCPACNRQTGPLKELGRIYKGKPVKVIEIDVGESLKTVKDHVKAKKITHTVLLDTDGAVAEKYGVRAIPLVLVLDKKGKILYKGNYTPLDRLKALIDPLVKEDKVAPAKKKPRAAVGKEAVKPVKPADAAKPGTK